MSMHNPLATAFMKHQTSGQSSSEVSTGKGFCRCHQLSSILAGNSILLHVSYAGY